MGDCRFHNYLNGFNSNTLMEKITHQCDLCQREFSTARNGEITLASQDEKKREVYLETCEKCVNAIKVEVSKLKN